MNWSVIFWAFVVVMIFISLGGVFVVYSMLSAIVSIISFVLSLIISVCFIFV
ncbi:hypothetical protein fHeYen901_280 [Yersinia phage fHe-Yen9-01]|uniref:Uncharacterized protein n=1 Tax=Yersinia phage fHe-Yen9-01 TaxID=1965363 RepID=A0A1V0DY22_9CAUD|nr:hypothetical protein KNT60_gp279 [Yersinia phage fHe-Yen9-01]ARB06053.1 hypothetical protein fHeYen901_280 [Yersinia phage fHe-Yen9-01]